MNEPSEGVFNDISFIEQGGTPDGLSFFNSGIGASLSYDTRDVPANAYEGIFIEGIATIYNSGFGSDNNFQVYSLQYRHFKELEFIGKRKVLAWMLSGRFTAGDVPLTELSMIGSPYDLRGYYMGQYRDKNTILSVVEYRHMFNSENSGTLGKIVNKLGFAGWAGLGTTDPDFIDIEGVMPNFGAGLRIELQPRMNFRIDFGHNPLNNQTLMYFNMTEAF